MAGPVAPIVAPIAASAPAVTAGPVAPIVAPIAASVPAVTAGPVAPIVAPIASPVVSTTIPPPATFMNTGSSPDECIVPVTSGIISGTSTNTSGASATGSQEKQKRSLNNKEGKKNKDKNKNRASSTNEDELSVLREQVRQLIAERDKQKADAAHQSGPASDAQFDKPDTEAGLLAKMKLTDNKYLYNQIRSIATSLCEQGSIDCMIDWRRQPHDRLSKVASQKLAKRVPYLQKFTHNWAAYDILKTVLRNKRGYKRKMEKKHGIVDSCPAVGAARTPEAESQGSGMRGLDEDDVNDMDIGDRTARDESERNGRKTYSKEAHPENDDNDTDMNGDLDGSSDDDLDSDLISDLDEGSDSASEGEDSSDGDSRNDDSDSSIDEVDARRQRHVQEKRTKHARKTERYKAHVSKKSKSKSQSKPKSRSKKRRRLSLTSDDERVIEVRRLKKKSRQS
ncbi:hypothetical protein AGABI1DRAFT_133894 [Agaricus bisporus var. burnettii JB137-S8]|uniref:Uncharacterized protein n=1 Tax=Agaricus bisporus var. burnettii (strain JB137-S8 / ATCC MYA-4627 / FGSC 10392) TaxID=597362 RepID=K5VHS1_AGABU|nr:uncharacterized protein AGABI1DRAFT_133894 [Agaricus bisporus var. burnettii JB137-S8]EKM73904.1 hypothetical protein AGABI1DRAFT_133894 [Agaricus bisporus var. burnettii JB137-S8]